MKTIRGLGCVDPILFGVRVGVIPLFAIIFLLISASNSLGADERAIWVALKTKDHFAIMRHAIAPGTGDPEQFKLGDCATQRNLSAAGRKQAATIGDRFRANGIKKARVRSSQWCRCLETAEGLLLGPVNALPVLNSFFGQFEREAGQTHELKTWLDGQNLEQPLVLVTHQVNITALTGVFPASGEIIVMRRFKTGAYDVVGRIDFGAGF